MAAVIEEEGQEMVVNTDRRKWVQATVLTQEEAIGLHCRQMAATTFR